MTALPRVIPVLLLKNAGLVKTIRFREPKYVGDPLNAVKIFNEKEVDELVFLDITATPEKKSPPLKFLEQVAGECFMPLCYGGGIRSLADAREVINVGVEKLSVNSYAVESPSFIRELAGQYGSSTVVVAIDVKKNFFGKHEVHIHGGKKNTKLDPVKFAVEMNKMGAGEILLNSMDRDGTQEGYDLELVRNVSSEVDIPVIACGGAGNIAHFKEAVGAGASAVAAGSMFVFHGRHRAVLISYPSQEEIKETLQYI
jgi:cyclase